MNACALYAGSFDPITYGHIHVIERALAVFGRLCIGVLDNATKSPLFSTDDRVDLIRKSVSFSTVTVEGYRGLLVDWVRKKQVFTLVRGIRSMRDFEYESRLARVLRQYDSRIDTVHFMTDSAYSDIGSGMVKQFAQYKGDVSAYVPPYVNQRLKEVFGGNA